MSVNRTTTTVQSTAPNRKLPLRLGHNLRSSYSSGAKRMPRVCAEKHWYLRHTIINLIVLLLNAFSFAFKLSQTLYIIPNFWRILFSHIYKRKALTFVGFESLTYYSIPTPSLLKALQSPHL